MSNPTGAMLVIGDEILSGRTRDINAHVLAQKLTERGIDLIEVRFVPDDEGRIIAALDALRGAADHVFTSGGIGPTHDDITADCVAKAFGQGIGVRADARAILEAHYARMGTEVNAARLRMARVPDEARLIDNPVSGAPGFSVENVHVMAGVPKIFEAMLDGLLPGLTGGVPLLSKSLRVERPEGEIALALGQVAEAYPEASIGCYPFNVAGTTGCNLVVRSKDAGLLETVAGALERLVSQN